MKKTITLFFSIIVLFQLNAQISVLGGFSTFSADKWDTAMDLPTEGFVASPRSLTPFSNNIVFGLNYSIPIPNVGMRILPELNYTKFSSEGWDDVTQDQERLDLNVDLTNIAFLINTNIYLFNLEGDCDCPTFGKDGGFFKKGFHIQGGPGVVYSRKKVEQIDQTGSSFVSLEDADIQLAFVIGAGLDIGVSDKFTLTPFARLKWIAAQEWSSLATTLENTIFIDDNSNSISNIEVGVKLGFRYKN